MTVPILLKRIIKLSWQVSRKARRLCRLMSELVSLYVHSGRHPCMYLLPSSFAWFISIRKSCNNYGVISLHLIAAINLVLKIRHRGSDRPEVVSLWGSKLESVRQVLSIDTVCGGPFSLGRGGERNQLDALWRQRRLGMWCVLVCFV